MIHIALAIVAAPMFGLFAAFGYMEFVAPWVPAWAKVTGAVMIGISVAADRIVNAMRSLE